MGIFGFFKNENLLNLTFITLSCFGIPAPEPACSQVPEIRIQVLSLHKAGPQSVLGRLASPWQLVQLQAVSI